MFPKKNKYGCSLGKRLKELEQNMFVNDFLYNVLGEQAKADNRLVLREYLKISDQYNDDNFENNQMAVIEAE